MSLFGRLKHKFNNTNKYKKYVSGTTSKRRARRFSRLMYSNKDF